MILCDIIGRLHCWKISNWSRLKHLNALIIVLSTLVVITHCQCNYIDPPALFPTHIPVWRNSPPHCNSLYSPSVSSSIRRFFIPCHYYYFYLFQLHQYPSSVLFTNRLKLLICSICITATDASFVAVIVTNVSCLLQCSRAINLRNKSIFTKIAIIKLINKMWRKRNTVLIVFTWLQTTGMPV